MKCCRLWARCWIGRDLCSGIEGVGQGSHGLALERSGMDCMMGFRATHLRNLDGLTSEYVPILFIIYARRAL